MFELKIILRRLLNSPAYAAPAVLIVALGIGAVAIITAFLRGGLLNAFPYPEPDRISFVYAQRASDNTERWQFSGPEMVAVSDATAAFSDLAAFGGGSFNLTGGDFPVRVRGLTVTHEFFRVFGVEPILGRSFDVGDAGRSDLVVVGEEFYRRHLGADPGRLGSEVILNGSPRVVIGVVPERFRFIGAEAFVHYSRDPAALPPDRHSLYLIGRLRPGVDLHTAEDIIAATLQPLEADWRYLLRPLTANLERIGPSLVALAFAVLVLLGLIVTNLGGLQLARLERRRVENAIMVATGATPAVATRQWLIENFVLFAAGAAIGLAGAAYLLDLVVNLVPERAGGMELLPPESRVVLDAPTLATAVLTAFIASGLVAWAPALRARRLDVVTELHGSGATRRSRLQGMLVLCQVAIATLLVAMTVLVMHSHASLQSRELGFDPRAVRTFQISLPSQDYPAASDRAAFYAHLVERLQTVPGIERAGAAHLLPLEGFQPRADIQVRGERVNVLFNQVGPGYFETLRTPLRTGRMLELHDRADSEPVALVNQVFADRHFGGQAVDQLIVDADGAVRRIVGIVGDSLQHSIGAEPEPELYLPHAQATDPRGWSAVVVRGTPGLNDIRTVVAELDPAVPVFAIRTLGEVLQSAFGLYQLTRALLLMFGISALLLTLTGIYGLLAQFVSQRRRELGIRAALGAAPWRLSALVIWRCAGLVGAGLLIGLGSASLAGRLIQAMLVEVAPIEPRILLWAIGTIALTALAAALPSAVAAARLRPVEALRYQ